MPPKKTPLVSPLHHHHLRSATKRGLISLFIVTTIMAIGTSGMHAIEHMPWIRAFYFMSMIATAQGPTITPQTDAGLLFAAFMSFVSVGTVVAALGFIFGPFFGRLWHIGRLKLEEELSLLKEKQKKNE